MALLDFDPSTLPPESIPAALNQLAALQAQLAARLLERRQEPAAPEVDNDDRLITTREAATLLGHSEKWVYRHVKSLPFARRIGSRDYRFSVVGLHQWQARQRVR